MLLQWSYCEWPPTHQQKGSESTQIIIQTGTCFKIHKRFLNFRNFRNIFSSLCLVFTRLFEVFFFFFFLLWSSKSLHVFWISIPHQIHCFLIQYTAFYSVDWFLCCAIILIWCSLFCQNLPLLLDQWNRIQRQEMK